MGGTPAGGAAGAENRPRVGCAPPEGAQEWERDAGREGQEVGKLGASGVKLARVRGPGLSTTKQRQGERKRAVEGGGGKIVARAHGPFGFCVCALSLEEESRRARRKGVQQLTSAGETGTLAIGDRASNPLEARPHLGAHARRRQ